MVICIYPHYIINIFWDQYLLLFFLKKIFGINISVPSKLSPYKCLLLLYIIKMWFIIQLSTDTRNVEFYKIEPINALPYIITYQICLCFRMVYFSKTLITDFFILFTGMPRRFRWFQSRTMFKIRRSSFRGCEIWVSTNFQIIIYYYICLLLLNASWFDYWLMVRGYIIYFLWAINIFLSIFAELDQFFNHIYMHYFIRYITY